MQLPYTNPFVRDLAWVISSPEIVKFEAAFPVTQNIDNYHHWLTTLDNNPTPLKQHLQGIKRQTLGSYFERLVQFWLTHTSDGRILLENQVIYNGNQSLTELDLVYKNNNAIYHIELSIKLYLYYGDDPNNTTYYIGPNQQDHLGKKLRKFKHQHSLTCHKQSKLILKSLGIENPYPISLLKGYLFYPYNRPIQPPNWAHPNHLQGYWIQQHQLENQLAEGYFYIANKLDWLAPFQLESHHLLKNKNTLIQYIKLIFESKKSPILIYRMEPFLDCFKETERFFITPESWPISETLLYS